ncbi:MAG: hypothetical protein DWI11_06635 [Planctomycetota bacterium]|nr:MAG: hypothetical protein DWI11_06635 [Planctomycetota bacterium]
MFARDSICTWRNLVQIYDRREQMKMRQRTSIVCILTVGSFLSACASSVKPDQPSPAYVQRNSCAARDLPSLVMADSTRRDDAFFASRNDARLGSNREPSIRVSESNRYWAYDQYWIVNGRTFQNYQMTTLSREHLIR